jgi:hypothetical protein
VADEDRLKRVVDRLQESARAEAFNTALITSRLHGVALMAVWASASREDWLTVAGLAFDEASAAMKDSVARSLAKLPEFARPPAPAGEKPSRG